jgi:hypothetical protein
VDPPDPITITVDAPSGFIFPDYDPADFYVAGDPFALPSISASRSGLWYYEGAQCGGLQWHYSYSINAEVVYAEP